MLVSRDYKYFGYRGSLCCYKNCDEAERSVPERTSAIMQFTSKTENANAWLDDAKRWVKEADAVLIVAGAGISVGLGPADHEVSQVSQYCSRELDGITST